MIFSSLNSSCIISSYLYVADTYKDTLYKAVASKQGGGFVDVAAMNGQRELIDFCHLITIYGGGAVFINIEHLHHFFCLFNWTFCIFLFTSGDHKQKFYWGHKEILIPVFKNMADAMRKHPEVDVLINFASLRSAYDSSVETMNYPQVTGSLACLLLANLRMVYSSSSLSL